MGRKEDCKQISLVCVGSAHSVSATLGLPLLTACMLSQSTLLRLPVALQGSCLKGALGCMHIPALSSGSGSWVLHKGADLVGPAFCALPSFEQLRRPGAWRAHSLSLGVVYHITSPIPATQFPGCAISGVPCVSSGELISGCNPPGGYHPSRIPGRLGWQLGACSQFGGGCHLWA